MYPTIFALGVKGMGTRTKTASGVIVMSIVGGAVIPLAMGAITDKAVSYVIPALCFVGIALYALFAAEPDREEVAADPSVALG